MLVSVSVIVPDEMKRAVLRFNSLRRRSRAFPHDAGTCQSVHRPVASLARGIAVEGLLARTSVCRGVLVLAIR